MNFNQWLESEGGSAKTVEGYVRDVGLFSAWMLETRGVELSPLNLTSVDVGEWKKSLQAQGQRANTVNRKLAALKAYVRYALDTRQLDINPLKRVKGVKRQPLGPKWLSPLEQRHVEAEIERDLLAARTDFAKQQAVRGMALYAVMRDCGLRISEVCDLHWSDVTIGERSGEVLVRSGKGDKERVVPLNAEARCVLKEWMGFRSTSKDDHVFVGRCGEPLTPSGVQRWLAEIGRRAKVEVTPHRLRHTCAKELLRSGSTINEVQAWLGHESSLTTQIYLIPDANDLAQAAERLL